MRKIDYKKLALYLASATQLEGVQAISAKYPAITVDEAYQIQLQTVEMEVEKGHSITGKKIGLTSLAMQKSLGVNEPDYGHLLSHMQLENGAQIPRGRLLQPKVEGELAFVLKKDLVGMNNTIVDVINATDYIVPALEIVDSRIKNWQIKLEDTIADNASSGLYVLGEKQFKMSEVDLKNVGMAFFKNNQLVNTGAGVACLGNPLNAVVWLVNKLGAYDIPLKKGEVILSGALSAAENAVEGDLFTCKFNRMGEVTIQF